MKKLLFIIISLLLTVELFSADRKCYKYNLVAGHNYWAGQDFCATQQWPYGSTSYACYKKYEVSCDTAKSQFLPFEGAPKGYTGFYLSNIYGDLSTHKNPEPDTYDHQCNDTFIKDGKFYNCNPATNEATFVENSEGYKEKEDGFYPKCLTGYEAHNIGRLTSSGTENQFYCLKKSNDSPDSWVGQTPIDTSSSSGTYNNHSDGSISWTADNGYDYSYNPNTGVLIETNFRTGSGSAHAVGGSFVPGSSYTPNGLGYAPNPDGTYGNVGIGGTGGDGTGTGGNGDTGTGENPNPNTPDTPIDETPVSNSCNDSTLTLQEKMLCEMNQGIKKLNSESAPSNSLNQLMKDLNNKSTQNNDSLDILKNNTNVINQNLDATNTKLDNLNTNTNNTNSKLDNLNTTLGTLNNTLKDIEKNTKENSVPGEENGEDIDLDSINNKGDSISSGIDSLFDIYSTFSSNIQNQFLNIKTQIEDTQSLIVEPSNIFNKTEVSSCPTSYTIDFSSFGIPNKTISIDFCQYTSSLKPLVYFFVYITLMIGLISLSFRFLGVII